MKILAHGFEPRVKSDIKELLAFDLSHSRFSCNDMLNTLLVMSTFRSCAEGASKVLSQYRKCPSADTLLAYLKTASRYDLQSINDIMIVHMIRTLRSRGLLRKPVSIAIDWHDDMYYGDDDAEMVNGTKPKDGTSYAYQYMTACMLADGMRFTIYTIPIKSRKDVLSYVTDCISFITKSGIKIAGIALDAGFFSEEMIRYLNSTGYRYVIRVPVNKKIRSMNLKAGQKIEYELGGGTKTGLVCFAVSGTRYYIATSMTGSADRIVKSYRKRWGIETSYIVVEQFMPQTTSKKYVIRLFCFLFAVWMYNLWVLFNIGRKEDGLIVLELKIELLFSIAIFPSCPG